MVTVHGWGVGLIWYPSFLCVIYNVYRAPASTARVEGNQKTNKRLLNPIYCRMSDDRVEKRMSIPHNWALLVRAEVRKRLKFDVPIAHGRFADGSDVSMEPETGQTEISDRDPLRNITLELVRNSLWAVRAPSNPFDVGFEMVITA